MLIIISSSFIINIVYNISVYLFIKEYIIFANDESLYKNINSSLTASDNLKFHFATDGEGNYGYLGADDSFIPFKSGESEIYSGSKTWSGSERTTAKTISDTVNIGKNKIVLGVYSTKQVLNFVLHGTDSGADLSFGTSYKYDESTGNVSINFTFWTNSSQFTITGLEFPYVIIYF